MIARTPRVTPTAIPTVRPFELEDEDDAPDDDPEALVPEREVIATIFDFASGINAHWETEKLLLSQSAIKYLLRIVSVHRKI